MADNDDNVNDGLSQLDDDTSQTDNQDDQTDDTKQDDTDQQHEPAEGSKRWKEVYFEAKEAGRKIKEMEQREQDMRTDMDAMKDHNKALSDSILSTQDELSTANRPDPMEDPEGYETWITKKVERNIAKKGQDQNPNPNQRAKRPNNQLIMQEAAMSSIHDDYYEVAEKVMAEMKGNQNLYTEIMSKPNPPKALYDHHERQKSKSNDQNDQNQSQNFVEGNNQDQSVDVTKLSQREKIVANRLGLSEKDYIEQRIIIDKKIERGDM